MIYQNSPGSLEDVIENGCAMNCTMALGILYLNKNYTVTDQNNLWNWGISSGNISGDLDNDGKIDGDNEGVIQSYNALFDHLGLPLVSVLRIDPSTGKKTNKFPVTYTIPANCLYFCAWYYKVTHFVIGLTKPVIHDPWLGGSQTVKYGYPKQENGLRVFRRTDLMYLPKEEEELQKNGLIVDYNKSLKLDPQ